MTHRARICVVTGSRAEYGLLRPVMLAIRDHAALELLGVACGSHVLESGLTLRDVKRDFELAGVVPMQIDGRRTRADDAEAFGVGVTRLARLFDRMTPRCVLVLGDRIEAFAAAAAASISGLHLAHVHGGDRAEGIADEAMRHAITKLATLHFPATNASAERIVRMGEDPAHVHVVGSPAIDGLAEVQPLTDGMYAEFGAPRVVVLFHPVGRPDDDEAHAMGTLLGAVKGERPVVLSPNADPGRTGVLRGMKDAGIEPRPHMRRGHFLALLKRVAAEPGGVLVGNSSCGLIEASALRLPVVDVGDRQRGRERPANVVHCAEDAAAIAEALRRARALDLSRATHPYGDGLAGARIARILGDLPPDGAPPRKLCTY